MNSGRIWSSLRDNKLNSFIGLFLIDHKTHNDPEKKSYRVQYEEFQTLKRDAHRTPPGCMPMFQVDLQDLRLMVMEVAAFDEITKYVLELEVRLERASL